MPDDNTVQIDKLRQVIAALEAQQRELGLNFTEQIAELQRRLGEVAGISHSGSGAVATDRGVAGGEGSLVVGGNVYGDITIGASA